MPELPEVEHAVRTLRDAIHDGVIAAVRLIHPSLRRRVPPRVLRALGGARIQSVERRGKHQLARLDDGRILHVHFRMAGDWEVGVIGDPLPRHARAVLEFEGGRRVALVDPRALATVDVHPAGAPPDLGLGPEPADAGLTVEYLAGAFERRRGAIKPVLLDQSVIAGLGNIYAAEALWEARIDPRLRAGALARADLSRLIAAARRVIDRASGARYRQASARRLAVYDRAGAPCRRCRAPIERIVQAGRSTYFCPACQAPSTRG